MTTAKRQDTASNSIGAVLKATREQRGMSIEEAASQLNLKVAIIAKLESDVWDSSMATTFGKGYLRAYARLLKLSEREIMQAYELQTVQLRQAPNHMHSFSRKTSREAAEHRFFLLSFVVVVVLLGMFFISFWQTHLTDNEPVSVTTPDWTSSAPATTPQPATQETTTTSPAMATSDTLSTNEDGTESIEEPIPDDSSIETTEGELPQTTPVSTESEAVQTTAASSAEQPITAAETFGPQQAGSQVTGPQQAGPHQAGSQERGANPSEAPLSANATSDTVTPSDTSANASATPNTGSLGQLTLTLQEACWLEITDGSGKRLAYGLQTAGTTLALSGVYPIKVVLGNAKAATLTHAGVVQQFTHYKEGQVARLTLNGTE